MSCLLTAPISPRRGQQNFRFLRGFSFLRTCTPIQANTPLDLVTFFWYGITETFAGLVQYALPGNIAAACAILNDASVREYINNILGQLTHGHLIPN